MKFSVHLAMSKVDAAATWIPVESKNWDPFECLEGIRSAKKLIQ